LACSEITFFWVRSALCTIFDVTTLQKKVFHLTKKCYKTKHNTFQIEQSMPEYSCHNTYQNEQSMPKYSCHNTYQNEQSMPKYSCPTRCLVQASKVTPGPITPGANRSN